MAVDEDRHLFYVGHHGCGQVPQQLKHDLRFVRLPHAISPMMNGWASTDALSSSAASPVSPRRR
jgi:hypothetical protein